MASKKRLIDANILESWIDGGIQGAEEGQGNAPIVSLYDVLDELNSIPTEDAVEVVHGRWNIILSDYDDCELMKCSCCGDEFYDGDNDTVDSLLNYCPNCGAKMDGDTQ